MDGPTDGEGHVDRSSGATTGCDDVLVSQLSSAADASPLDLYEVNEIEPSAMLDPDYFASSGFVDPAAPVPHIESIDLDLTDTEAMVDPIVDFDDFDRPLSEHDLLVRLVKAAPPEVRALTLFESRMAALDISRTELYAKLAAESPLLSENAPLRAPLDGGSMCNTTN